LIFLRGSLVRVDRVVMLWRMSMYSAVGKSSKVLSIGFFHQFVGNGAIG
jgi:hypothetical protein